MTPAIDTAPCTVLPPPISALLDGLGLAYQTLTDVGGLPAAAQVQAVLLEDNIGSLLVLLARDQLLDLSRLHELTGRQLLSVSAERLQRILGKHRLGNLPALPPLTSSPCLYDQRLLEQPRLYIESGQPGLVLAVDSGHYRQCLLAAASAARIGEPLQGIRPNFSQPAQDHAQIVRAVHQFTARRIQQRLEESLEIPPLPASARRMLQLRGDPETTIDDITGVVETDPALAAQLISWAASAYYAVPFKVRSVEDAVSRVLGTELVINLTLSLALGKTLALPKTQARQGTSYWQQALYAAALIEGLVRAMPRSSRPEAGLGYLAGLLHNFGYLLLAHVFPPHFSLICRHLEANPHLPASYIEQHLLGITREQMAAWLAGVWGMPEELVSALRLQNDPQAAAEHAVYANLVYLAVNLLRRSGRCPGPAEAIPEPLLQRLGLNLEQAEAELDKVLKAEAVLRELAAQLG